MNMVLLFARRGLVLAAMISVLSPSWGRAQPAVREWPDPGYRRLGVYGSGPDSYFDYQLVKLRLRDNFPDKKAYWAGLKSHAGRRNASHRHNIYFVYCGERSETLETCKARVDAWLAPEADLLTHPELIPAICLGEENVRSRNAVLDGLARHIRETYGIPVFQFYSMPLSPSPDLTADGSVLDAYGMQDVQFRKHLMKFVALGKPVVCIPWASDPHWPGWTRSENTAAMIDREWGQFPICMEFDVSCAVFSVAGPGAMNPWLSSRTPDMIQLRNCLRTKRQQMHALAADDLPLATANFSARDRSVPVGGDADCPSVYEEHFSGFGWIHDADVQGFLNLQLTSKPDPVGFLNMNMHAEEVTRAALTWRFESYFPLEEVQITLDAAAPPAADCRKRLVEIKPSDRLAKPITQRKLEVARQFAVSEGWTFHLVTEKELLRGPLLANLQLIGRYRQAVFDPALLRRIRKLVVSQGISLGELCGLADETDPVRARTHVFHLLAVGALSFDPQQEPISDPTLIFPGGEITWDPFDSVWAPSGCSTGGLGVWSANSPPIASSPKTPNSS